MQIKFKLSGLHCPSCSLMIDGTLAELPGVKEVQTNYALAVTKVDFDEQKQSVSNLIKTIENLGYKIDNKE